jgi:hypothetical protein
MEHSRSTRKQLVTRKAQAEQRRQKKAAAAQGPLLAVETIAGVLQLFRGFRASAVPRVLQAVQDKMTLIETADTAEGENRCVDAMMQPFWNWSAGDISLIRVALRGVIQESLHYRRGLREEILSASLRRATELAEQAQQLKAMLPAVKKALFELDVRVLAFSQVQAILHDAGPIAAADFRADVLWPAQDLGKSKIDVLRKDRRLTGLIKAYDLAAALCEAY